MLSLDTSNVAWSSHYCPVVASYRPNPPRLARRKFVQHVRCFLFPLGGASRIARLLHTDGKFGFFYSMGPREVDSMVTELP